MIVFSKLLEKSTDLTAVLFKEIFSVEEKRSVLNALFDRMEFSETIQHFLFYLIGNNRTATFFDIQSSFEQRMNDFEKKVATMPLQDGIQVFIGREHPFSKVTDFSIMIAECDFPEQGRGKVALLGPKRMAYPKNIHLLKTFSQAWKNSKT